MSRFLHAGAGEGSMIHVCYWLRAELREKLQLEDCRKLLPALLTSLRVAHLRPPWPQGALL